MSLSSSMTGPLVFPLVPQDFCVFSNSSDEDDFSLQHVETADSSNEVGKLSGN